eukprot:13631688-Alexandrium_andersonii.AAC.1
MYVSDLGGRKSSGSVGGRRSELEFGRIEPGIAEDRARAAPPARGRPRRAFLGQRLLDSSKCTAALQAVCS